MSEKSIWVRRGLLVRERREFMRTAMAEFDKTHREKMRALQAECEAIGHNWKFTDLGPLGDPWFTCTTCRATRVELADA
jgi:hypothetical protein